MLLDTTALTQEEQREKLREMTKRYREKAVLLSDVTAAGRRDGPGRLRISKRCGGLLEGKGGFRSGIREGILMRRKVFLVAAALFLASCGKEKQVEPAIQDGAGGRGGTNPAGRLLERYSASIEPFAKVDLAFKSGGIVEGILQVRGADGRIRNVQAGDKVSSGCRTGAGASARLSEHALDQAEARRAQARGAIGAGAGAAGTGAREFRTRPHIDYAAREQSVPIGEPGETPVRSRQRGV